MERKMGVGGKGVQQEEEEPGVLKMQRRLTEREWCISDRLDSV